MIFCDFQSWAGYRHHLFISNGFIVDEPVFFVDGASRMSLSYLLLLWLLFGKKQINLLQRVQRCLLAKFGTRHVDASSVAMFGNLPNLRSAGGLWLTPAKSGNLSFGLNVEKRVVIPQFVAEHVLGFKV